jgi:hypothetical protein
MFECMHACVCACMHVCMHVWVFLHTYQHSYHEPLAHGSLTRRADARQKTRQKKKHSAQSIHNNNEIATRRKPVGASFWRGEESWNDRRIELRWIHDYIQIDRIGPSIHKRDPKTDAITVQDVGELQRGFQLLWTQFSSIRPGFLVLLLSQ